MTRTTYYSDETLQGVTNKSDWVRTVDNGWLLSDLRIPGTHESCALYGATRDSSDPIPIEEAPNTTGAEPFKEFAQCQSWSLFEQLNAGIRFLDIRCINRENRFDIYHGPYFQQKNFDSVLEDCKNFLSVHPSEFIIMRVRKESADEGSERSFSEIFDSYYNVNSSLISLTDHIPTVGEVRGKIWIINDFDKSHRGYKWDDLQSWLQDEWKVEKMDNERINWKKDKIKNGFDKVRNKGELYINFSSGSSSNGTGVRPFDLAKSYINQYVEGIVNSSGIRAGIVAMDFPGEDLIKEIINQNYVDPNTQNLILKGINDRDEQAKQNFDAQGNERDEREKRLEELQKKEQETQVQIVHIRP